MFPANFFDDLVKFNKLKMQKKTKQKTNVYSTASELYKDLLGIYFDKYYKLSNAKRKKIDSKYDPDKLFFTRIE